jgi:hypothetical protein
VHYSACPILGTWSIFCAPVMCVLRQKPRLEAENLLPRPRCFNASPRAYCLGLAPHPDLMLRHRRSEPLSYVIYLGYVTRSNGFKNLKNSVPDTIKSTKRVSCVHFIIHSFLTALPLARTFYLGLESSASVS